jgi:hypothetical protein
MVPRCILKFPEVEEPDIPVEIEFCKQPR